MGDRTAGTPGRLAVAVSGVCARPGCVVVLLPRSAGRPRRFCSDACRKAEYNTVTFLARVELARRHAAEYRRIWDTIAAGRQDPR